MNYMDSTAPSWTRSTLLSDRTLKRTKAKVHVYSDSVLCLGKIHDPVEAVEPWKAQVTTFRMENSSSEPSGLNGEPIEFEFKILPGFTALQILHKIQSDLEEAHIDPEEFSDRIVFMSMFNDINADKKGNDTSCTLTSVKIQEYATRFMEGRWAFLGPGEGEKWFRGYDHKPEGRWDSIASEMVRNFKDSGHPEFKRTSALNRGIMRKKKDKDTIHYHGESSNVELMYRIIHSANQLCVYGAVTNWCETLGRTEFEKQKKLGMI